MRQPAITGQSGGWRSRLRGWLYGNPLYSVTLAGPTPRMLRRASPTRHDAEAARGQKILDGTLTCAGRTFESGSPNWFDDAADARSLSELHSFSYLADLAVVGEPARECARKLVASWLASGFGWHDVSWAPHVLGTRIAAWLEHWDFLFFADRDPLQSRALRSLARQSRHLNRVLMTGCEGIPGLNAIRGLICAGACGVASRRAMNRGLKCLARSISAQIRDDGTHAERSPSAQQRVLAVLVAIRAIVESGSGNADILSATTARVAAKLASLRHGDGRLALFNASVEGSARALEELLVTARDARAPVTGCADGAVASFQRLSAGSTLVIQDAGLPPPPNFDLAAHAGTLSFEMSSGRDRIVVNCGHGGGPPWHLLRTTAAHSTLVVADTNSAEIVAEGGLGRSPRRVECQREERDGNVWLTTSHDGYKERFGLIHRRRLYLAAAGDNLRGEDALLAVDSRAFTAIAYAVRFHLHPHVQASLVQNAAALLLRLPSGIGWRFHISGAVPQLAESLYAGDGQTVQRTQQIVASGRLDSPPCVVKWAFQRL